LEEEEAPEDRTPKNAGADPAYMNRWLHPEATAELYPNSRLGSHRLGLAGQVGKVQSFSIPEQQDLHMLYVEGDWIVKMDALELAGGNGKLSFKYRAERVGLYVTPPTQGKARFQVRLDGTPITVAHAGSDINDESQVVMDRPRLYLLTEHPGFEAHQLELELDDVGTRIHRFSFLPFRGVLEDS
jgi:hypothetical protein